MLLEPLHMGVGTRSRKFRGSGAPLQAPWAREFCIYLFYAFEKRLPGHVSLKETLGEGF